MKNVLVVLPDEVKELSVKISEKKREEVNNVLTQIFAGTSDWKSQADAIIVKDINDKMSIALAEQGRKNVKNARLSAEKVFDSKREEVQQLKSEFDLEDKLWLKAKQTAQILFKDIESTFEWKANFVKRYESEQKELTTQLRVEKVSKFNTEINRIEFENMSNEMFDLFLSGIEKSYNDKIETEKKAEAEKAAKEKAIEIHNNRKESILPFWSFIPIDKRNDDFSKLTNDEWIERFTWTKNEKIKYDKKQEEIRIENERLKKEQEALIIRNKKRNDELKGYIVFIRDYNALLNSDENEYQKEFSEIKKGAELQWEYDRKEAKRKSDKEQKEIEERKAIEAKLKAKEDSEKKEIERKQAEEKAAKIAQEKALKAPKKEKLTNWIDGFVLGTPIGMHEDETVLNILIKFDGFKDWAKSQIKNI